MGAQLKGTTLVFSWQMEANQYPCARLSLGGSVEGSRDVRAAAWQGQGSTTQEE